jgi:hypothetical protein
MQVGSTYKHFKGNLYKVLYIAHHTETDEEMVVYKDLAGGNIWVRPLEMFLENVETPYYKGPRFTLLVENN